MISPNDIHIDTNESFATGPCINGAIKYMLRINPKAPGTDTNFMYDQSTLIFEEIINTDAAVIPMLWIAKAKFLASEGSIFNKRVKTGYAIAALPSGLEPAINEPNTMVTITQRFSGIK